MFSSVKSSGADEAEIAAVGNLLRLWFLSWDDVVVVSVFVPFLSCSNAGAVEKLDER